MFEPVCRNSHTTAEASAKEERTFSGGVLSNYQNVGDFFF